MKSREARGIMSNLIESMCPPEDCVKPCVKHLGISSKSDRMCPHEDCGKPSLETLNGKMAMSCRSMCPCEKSYAECCVKTVLSGNLLSFSFDF